MEGLQIQHIACDTCEYIGKAEEWLDENSPNLREFLMEKKGWDIATPEGKRAFEHVYSGAVCPACGSSAEIDVDPYEVLFPRSRD
ncbi:MAG: hypothetical protein Q8P39_00465 [Candidatus Yanofskybacteria bacterium]|nr:hypothetical protein [Candidatus Yanofskybacteria bacterium]